MQVIQRGGYSREEILDALHSKTNARNVRFRYDLLDKEGNYKKTLRSVIGGEVAMSAFSTIKRTAKFKVKEEYVPESIGRETQEKVEGYDSSFAGWDGAGSVVVSGAVKLSSPAVSVAPEWQMENKTNNIANGWTQWGASGLFGSSSGIQGTSQVMTKTATTNSSFGIQTVAKPLSVVTGDWVYLSFFMRKDGHMPFLEYNYALAGDGLGNLSFGNTTANSATMSFTDVGGGWTRVDCSLRMPRSTTVGALIACYTSASGGYRVDNVYFQKNIPPIWMGEAISPVIDLSDQVAYGNDAPRYKTSRVTFSKTYGDYNSASFATRPANILYSRYSLNEGASWSGWTEQEVGAINGIPSNADIRGLQVQFKFYGERYSHLDNVSLDAINVEMTYERDVLFPETTEINYLTDRIQPFMEIKMPDDNWIEFPLGVFLLSSPTRIDGVNGSVYREIEAYDGLLIIDEDKFTERYVVRAGTRYTQAVNDILSSAGVTLYSIEESTLTLTADKEFATGTSKLEAISELLQAINYTPIWVDSTGYFTSTPYVSPTDRAVDYAYEDNELSVTYNGMEEELDIYSIPNMWVAVESNPDKPSPLQSRLTNADKSSPTSTVNMGRNIVDFREVDEVANQKTLDDYIKRIAFEASQVFGKLKFKTAMMPFHEYSDVIHVRYAPLKVNHKFSETAWRMTLEAGAEMEHEARRVVDINVT